MFPKYGIPNSTPTYLCGTTTVGAMNVTNPLKNGLIALHNVSVIQVDINIMTSWISVPGLGKTPAGSIGKPSVAPGKDTSKDTEDYGYMLKPTDESRVAVVVTDRGREFPWDGPIPEDEEELARLLSKLNIDMEALSENGETGKGQVC